MRLFWVVLSALLAGSLVGCNTLKRLTHAGQTETPNNTLPDDYTVTGATSLDYQVIQVRCVDSTVTVEVKKSNEDSFRTLNTMEFFADPRGTGGGGVWMQKKCLVSYAYDGTILSFTILREPVAPAGSQYRIRSVLKGSAGSHNLY